ncbi:MAG: hypothetical protein ACI9R3_004121 [Verrucomicrobiales bacterium]|jgi:hypothetical protein
MALCQVKELRLRNLRDANTTMGECDNVISGRGSGHDAGAACGMGILDHSRDHIDAASIQEFYRVKWLYQHPLCGRRRPGSMRQEQALFLIPIRQSSPLKAENRLHWSILPILSPNIRVTQDSSSASASSGNQNHGTWRIW